MNRILFEEHEITDGRAVFSDARAEHVLNVLHGSVGQVLKTGTVNGLAGTSVIEEIRNLHTREPGSAQRGSGLLAGEIIVSCTHRDPAPAPWIDLILAPPRPRVLKRLLPQLTAMGAGTIVLTGAAKVEKAFWGAQLVKEEVYRPLLIEGLMQCGTTVLPTIRIEKNFKRYVETRLETDFPHSHRIIAHPPDTPRVGTRPRGWGHTPDVGTLPRGGDTPRTWGHTPDVGTRPRGGDTPQTWGHAPEGGDTPPVGTRSGWGHAPEGVGEKPLRNRPVVAIGPEGGWTDDEVALLESKGFTRYSLGNRILRTDTAAIALLAQLMTRAAVHG